MAKLIRVIITAAVFFGSVAALAGDEGDVREILNRLDESVGDVNTLESEIVYEVKQPLFESSSTRRGVLYYKNDSNEPKLRINFTSLQQDDDEPQEYKEYYIFEGKWLTHVNFQIEEVKKYELSDSNEPVDPFDIARMNFPILGLSKDEELGEDFDISIAELPEEQVGKLVKLKLDVKEGSRFEDEYSSIDFWIDRSYWLPSRITSYTLEEDVYELVFNDLEVNRSLSDEVFDYNLPDRFGEAEIIRYDELNSK